MSTPNLSAEQIATARTKLGLAEDTTDEQVVAKLSELTDLIDAAKSPANDASDGAGEGAGGPQGGPPATGEPIPPAALSGKAIEEALASGQVSVVPTPVLDQLKADAALGADAHARLSAQAREDVLDQAQRDGKLGAGKTADTVRAQLAANLEKDFDGTKALIDALPQIVPVGEVGHDGPGSDNAQLAAAAEAAWDSFITEHFGDEIPAKEA